MSKMNSIGLALNSLAKNVVLGTKKTVKAVKTGGAELKAGLSGINTDAAAKRAAQRAARLGTKKPVRRTRH